MVVQDVVAHIDAIEEISLIAQKQNGLEKTLEAMRKEWTTQKFKFMLHKVRASHTHTYSCMHARSWPYSSLSQLASRSSRALTR